MSNWSSFYVIRFDGRSVITCNCNIDTPRIRPSINSSPGRTRVGGRRWESVVTRRICIAGWSMFLSIACTSSTARTWSIDRGKSWSQCNAFWTSPTTFGENTSISIRTNAAFLAWDSRTDVSAPRKAGRIHWSPARRERSYERSTRRAIEISKLSLKSTSLGFNQQLDSVVGVFFLSNKINKNRHSHDLLILSLTKAPVLTSFQADNDRLIHPEEDDDSSGGDRQHLCIEEKVSCSRWSARSKLIHAELTVKESSQLFAFPYLPTRYAWKTSHHINEPFVHWE